jgi:hypothetical protein
MGTFYFPKAWNSVMVFNPMELLMKRMTRDQFNQATSSLTMGESTLEIAEGVLVDGKSQSDYARAKQITRGAVSQIVSKVWKIHLKAVNIPDKFVEVTAVLPEYQAFIVKQWEKEAQRREKEHPGNPN